MTTESSEMSVRFEFTRSPFFRVIHMNGVWGGVAPSGEIQLAFFIERDPYPVEITHRLEDGRIGDEISRRRSVEVEHQIPVERELQVEVRLSLAQAKTVRDWLNRYIDQLTTVLEKQQANAAPPERDG